MHDKASELRGSGSLPGPRPLIGLVAVLLLLWPAACPAHGVSISCREGRAMVVEAAYDDGDPMDYVKVRIQGPDGRAFQVGNTDAHGRFAWVPDRSGQWTITTADGMGHKAAAKVQAGPVQDAGPVAPAAPADSPRWAKVIWGLNALFFIFGLLSWLASRRRVRSGRFTSKNQPS